jgi:hypothetical protein
MTWKDKLEVGLKDDAPFRRDNLPEFQQTPGPDDEGKPDDPTRSPEEPGAREEAARQAASRGVPKRRRTRRPPATPRTRRPRR